MKTIPSELWDILSEEDRAICMYRPEEENLFQEGDFAVQTTVITDPVLSDDVLAYGVYNIVTGIREAETRRLSNAVRLAANFATESEKDEAAPEYVGGLTH